MLQELEHQHAHFCMVEVLPFLMIIIVTTSEYAPQYLKPANQALLDGTLGQVVWPQKTCTIFGG